MKSIEQIIKNFLIEVRTQQKGEFNRGMEHRIYSSKNNPNRLFKVGDEGVLHWVKVFRSNPNIFAEVFRTGKINDSEVRGTYYAEIEKLQLVRDSIDRATLPILAVSQYRFDPTYYIVYKQSMKIRKFQQARK
jgi:hypothetical protein